MSDREKLGKFLAGSWSCWPWLVVDSVFLESFSQPAATALLLKVDVPKVPRKLARLARELTRAWPGDPC